MESAFESREVFLLFLVPFYGEAASREIIFKYELFHKGLQGKPAGLKA
uniref:Uncharacterized protein n=1 Tax=Cryptococcus bacillisporus CA1280 TaxID=1296109 RepID=A0A0D0VBZ6_CRYGA|nr:hypothetical protein I312_06820 [Cryptococcus bacillisporus CA1280]